MLEAVLRSLNNWFDRDGSGRFFHVESGELSVKGGSLLGAGEWLADGQWYRILGSRHNDGLHRHPAADLLDEEFEGCAYELRIPPAVVELAERVAAWEEANGDASRGVYASESFGGYSYSLKGDGAADSGSQGWKRAFADELRGWRKL